MERLLAFMNENPAAWFLLLSGFCVLAGLYSLIFQYRVRHWPYVWGVLQGAAVQETGATEWTNSDQAYRAKVRYVYEVNGSRFEGHRLSAMTVVASHNAQALLQQQLERVERRGEEKAKVYFDPKNPTKSYLINGSMTQLLVTLALIAFMIWVGFLAMAKLGLPEDAPTSAIVHAGRRSVCGWWPADDPHPFGVTSLAFIVVACLRRLSIGDSSGGRRWVMAPGRVTLPAPIGPNHCRS